MSTHTHMLASHIFGYPTEREGKKYVHHRGSQLGGPKTESNPVNPRLPTSSTAPKPKKYSVPCKKSQLQEEKPFEVTPKQMRNKRLGGLFFPPETNKQQGQNNRRIYSPRLPPFSVFLYPPCVLQIADQLEEGRA